MIIIDYSGIAMAGAIAMHKTIKDSSKEDAINIIRHVILSGILAYKRKYSKEYGKIVIACDGPSYWRREVFKEYKGNRKKDRDNNSILDWSLIFEALALVRQELIDYFPYNVIHLDRCEADDIIACLTKEYRTELGKQEPIMIISSDVDMNQLQKYNEVSQYSPMTKKLIKVNRKQINEYLINTFVKGQKKDGIPSYKQSDDALIKEDKERAPAVSAKTLQKFMELGIDACTNDLEKARYQRNQKMMDFDMIPDDIYNLIINTYENQIIKFDRMKLMNFLIKKRCRQLLDNIQDF